MTLAPAQRPAFATSISRPEREKRGTHRAGAGDARGGIHRQGRHDVAGQARPRGLRARAEDQLRPAADEHEEDRRQPGRTTTATRLTRQANSHRGRRRSPRWTRTTGLCRTRRRRGEEQRQDEAHPLVQTADLRSAGIGVRRRPVCEDGCDGDRPSGYDRHAEDSLTAGCERSSRRMALGLPFVRLILS